MNYLTNYYKNLSEQLQEQVNLLESILDEAYIQTAAEKLKKKDEEDPRDYRTRSRQATSRDDFFVALTDLTRTTTDQNLKDIAARIMRDAIKVKGYARPGEDKRTDVKYAKEFLNDINPENQRSPTNRVQMTPARTTLGVKGYAEDTPAYGYATPDELRTILKALKGTEFGKDYFLQKKRQ